MMTTAVTSLTINTIEREAKGNLLFIKRADKIFNEPNADGVKTGGFGNIYNGLIDRSAAALSAFWSCALPGVKEDAIDSALTEAIMAHGWDALFRGAIKVMDNDLILKGQTEIFWDKMDAGLRMMKDDKERQEFEEGIQTLKEMKEEYMRPVYDQENH